MKKRKKSLKQTFQQQVQIAFNDIGDKQLIGFALVVQHPLLEQPIFLPMIAGYDSVYKCINHELVRKTEMKEIMNHLAAFFHYTLTDLQDQIKTTNFAQQYGEQISSMVFAAMVKDPEIIEKETNEVQDHFAFIGLTYDDEGVSFKGQNFPNKQEFLNYVEGILDMRGSSDNIELTMHQL